MKKKLNSLSDLSTIKFDNLSPDKEDIVDPIEEDSEKLHFELRFDLGKGCSPEKPFLRVYFQEVRVSYH